VLFCFQVSFAQKYNQTFFDICDKHGIVGGTLLTHLNGQTTINHYGLSNIANNKIVNNQTFFKVASISKLITALGIMKLYENGLIDVNNDISNYLGFDVKNPYHMESGITVKMLLNHTSSLFDEQSYFEFLNSTHKEYPKPYISSLFNKLYSKKLFLNKKPGEYFSYSNLNYVLLGVIIERVTGKRFDQYMDETIFNPLNIKGGFNLYNIDFSNVSTLYRLGISQMDDNLEDLVIDFTDYVIGETTLLFSPHSGCRLSVLDLVKVMDLFLNTGKYFDGDNYVTLLQKNTIELMLKTTWLYDGLNGDDFFGLFNQWGLGLHIANSKKCDDFIFKNQIMYGHIGQAYGLLASLFFNIEKNTGFIFIVNGYYNTSYINGETSSFFKIQEEIFDYVETSYLNDTKKMYNILGLKLDNLEKKRFFVEEKNSGNYVKKIIF